MACNDPEGWAVVSSRRSFDTTVCFEEGIIQSSLYTLLFFAAVFTVLSECLSPPLVRSSKSRWLLRTKTSFLILAFGTSLANLINVIILHEPVALLQSYILEPIALFAAIFLTYYNHTRARSSSTALLIYWPLYTIALAIWVRTAVSNSTSLYRLPIALKCAVASLGLISFALECIGPEFDQKQDKASHENPVITANIFSSWSFSWMTPLMRKGAEDYITEQDLPDVQPKDESDLLGQRLKRALTKHPLWSSLFIAYGKPYLFAVLLKFVSDCIVFTQPQLLRLLLSYFSMYQSARFGPWTTDTPKPNPLEGFVYAALMFVAATSQTVILNQYFQCAFETGMRVRSGLVDVLYKKALVLSNDELDRSSGDLVNLMSVDATRLQDFCQFGIIALSGPFQILLAFISLYNLLGWPAFVGVAIMVISVPLNTFVEKVMARFLKRMQLEQMKNRDKRTRLMSELLANIKSIKLYGWEFAFLRRILQVRNNQELVMLKKLGIVTSLNQMLWGGIPLLVAFSSFAVAAVVSDQPLTADVIFPAISLFMLLQFPIAMFSQVTSNVVEAVVSIQRLSNYLGADELQPDARKIVKSLNLQPGDEVLSIKNADFTWSKNAVQPTLEGINLSVRKGELVGVLGKTSLLAGIIGDMTRREGEVLVRAWLFSLVCYRILSATIRENILFAHEYDETFYNLVVEGCALGPDLALLPQGDATEVGEKGITLSGGQRARIALARAVYARADLVLLDDCLAAVDSHVARHIFTRVIGPQGLLANKARILVTNSIAFVKQFDQLIYIRRGIVLESGSYASLMANEDGEIPRLIRGHGSTSGSGTSTPFHEGNGTSGAMTPVEDTTFSEDKSIILSEKLRRHASFSKPKMAAAPPTRAPASVGLSEEHKERGRVKVSVYMKYIQAASKTAFGLFIVATVAGQAVSVTSNFALRAWAEHNRETGSNEGMFQYILLYGLLLLSQVLLSGASAILVWVFCSIRSARQLHDNMLDALIRAPLSFFELTPTGRILNLFSRDVYVVDGILGRVISMSFRMFVVTSSIIIIIGSSFPWFLIAVPPLTWFYLTVMKYYLATSRELKRLDAVSRSPIFAWFSESLAGISTIRAFDQQAIFIANNQRRVDRNQICYLASISVNRWLSIRLEFVGALIIWIVATLACVALVATGGSSMDAGLVGLVLSYALNATSSLNWLVRTASEVEQNIVSVERILHQTEVLPEAPFELSDQSVPQPWPTSGTVEFKGYSTRYRPELDLVLREIDLNIKASEKIGVVGRTGAGKSSLLLALFRIIEPVQGTILVDGIDITKIGLHDLRSSISIVPQSPDLFEGTLRENIDPVGEHSDADIWDSLAQVHLKEFVEGLPGGQGLDEPVREGGSSLSSGQRQLLCFARALLRKSKVLVLDEGNSMTLMLVESAEYCAVATSAIDLDTDAAIQDIIRGPAFKDVTVLTIAHRLNTIIDSDRVLVMDSGKVAEFDTPEKLLGKRDSIFYSLATDAGLVSGAK
ncbi:hypothetical protein D9757_004866 [Collybiopsis confluens]|uniref:Metal resistance protein YCF1 n=1 Tax=Collybiopsis confluens TaxID=2823264 RepID=A0A8H5MBT8_9AGAR|nr:hypothetical protein D9757_004866 [Collybiopsis confluens]